jgi:ribosomal protein L37AE/L43A
MTLHVIEFMRRFLTHVLPRGFVRIRHIGLLGSRSKVDNINKIRELQGLEPIEKQDCKENFKELLKRITGIDVHRCPKCQSLSLRPAKTFKGLLNSA